ncbi:MAG: chemotaxis protein CheX [Terriglobales bacterium]
MTADTAFAKPSPGENFLPILERATQEVFEIMLGCQVKLAEPSEHTLRGGFTAIVGLAGALCGVVTVCCAPKTASQIALGMLGDAANSDGQAVDALGEICNMIAGNFKNKLAGTDERCMLSVPSVISGGEYKFHSLVDGSSMDAVVLFEDAPVAVRLQLKS